MSPDANLYYGFLLGCPNDGGWEVAEADEYGGLEDAGLSWVEAAEDDGDHQEHMTLAIFVGMGIEVTDMPSRELDEMLAERCGVQIVSHGSMPSDMMHYGIALAGTVHRADDYTPKAIDLGAVSDLDPQSLRDALSVLGLSPNQANPSWILAPGEG